VASFVGEANFLPGTAEGGRILCELGEVPVESGVTGEVEAMLRPEVLDLRADPAGKAVVVGREFYGHDQLIKLRLNSGRTILSRPGAGPGFEPGERVAVEVRGSALVFSNP
jgi:iron(III) transport system ATP-binding protein